MKKIFFVLFLILFVSCISPPIRIPKDYNPISENSNIYVNNDNIKGYNYYSHKLSFGSENIELYVAENVKTKKRTKRIMFNYFGSNWIFFTTAIMVDGNGNKIQYSFKSYDKTTDVGNAGVYEGIDLLLDNKNYEILKKIINSNTKITLRLSGKYYEDFILNEKTIVGLKEMISFIDKK